MALEELRVAAQPLEQPLGVVEPIHRQDDARAAQLVSDLPAAGLYDLALGGALEALDLDAQREGVGAPDLVALGDAAEAMIATDGAQHTLQEVLGVFVDVKADQVGAEHALEQLLLPGARQHAEELEGGERGVQEEADAGFGVTLPQHR